MTARIEGEPVPEDKKPIKEKPPCLFGTLPFVQSMDGVSALESLLTLYNLVADREATDASNKPLLLNVTRVLQALNYESTNDMNAKEAPLAQLRKFLLSKLDGKLTDPDLRSGLVAVFVQVIGPLFE